MVMAAANMERGRRVRMATEEFLMIVVFPWLFRFRIARIHNILTEVAFCLEAERIRKLVRIKTIICTQLLGLPLKKRLILTLELTLTKLIRLKLATNPSPALATHKAANNPLAPVKMGKTAVPTSVPPAKPRAPLLHQSSPANQRPVWMIPSSRSEIN
jgi:hypothetical protein